VAHWPPSLTATLTATVIVIWPHQGSAIVLTACGLINRAQVRLRMPRTRGSRPFGYAINEHIVRQRPRTTSDSVGCRVGRYRHVE
jgi:hypothetical protein